jgi:hypothetical protein
MTPTEVNSILHSESCSSESDIYYVRPKNIAGFTNFFNILSVYKYWFFWAYALFAFFVLTIIVVAFVRKQVKPNLRWT